MVWEFPLIIYLYTISSVIDYMVFSQDVKMCVRYRIYANAN